MGRAIAPRALWQDDCCPVCMVLNGFLAKMAEFEPAGFPVISLYLNTQRDQHGRPHFDAWLRKELQGRAKTYPLRSAQRESFDRDAERIQDYLANQLQPSIKGAVIFASAGAGDFFEAIQLEAPVGENRLHVSDQPSLYRLALLNDEYPRYAALVADTNSARLFVFGLGTTLNQAEVVNPKVKRVSAGGWSQARYQRHADNSYLHHAKEVIDALDRVVREEKIQHVLLAGDEMIVPVLMEQLPDRLQEKVVDILRLDMTTPEHEVLRVTFEAMRERDAREDAERVGRMLDQSRAGGLAVAGMKGTLAALERGQVDELLLSAALPEDEQRNELVTRAAQTGARVTFIENPALLGEVEGAGAFLRYQLSAMEGAA